MTTCNYGDPPAHLQQDLLLQVLVGSVQQLFGPENPIPHHVLGPTPRQGKQRPAMAVAFSEKLTAVIAARWGRHLLTNRSDSAVPYGSDTFRKDVFLLGAYKK